jgi:hypothetical protein
MSGGLMPIYGHYGNKGKCFDLHRIYPLQHDRPAVCGTHWLLPEACDHPVEFSLRDAPSCH